MKDFLLTSFTRNSKDLDPSWFSLSWYLLVSAGMLKWNCWICVEHKETFPSCRTGHARCRATETAGIFLCSSWRHYLIFIPNLPACASVCYVQSVKQAGASVNTYTHCSHTITPSTTPKCTQRSGAISPQVWPTPCLKINTEQKKKKIPAKPKQRLKVGESCRET